MPWHAGQRRAYSSQGVPKLAKSKIDPCVLKFDYIKSSKSKNINQLDENITLKLIAIDVYKKQENYEIILLFSENAIITLSAEIIEVTLEDQKILNVKNN